MEERGFVVLFVGFCGAHHQSNLFSQLGVEIFARVVKPVCVCSLASLWELPTNSIKSVKRERDSDTIILNALLWNVMKCPHALELV